MSEITFQSEVPTVSLIDEARALFRRHFDEIAAHHVLFGAPNPDRAWYESIITGRALHAVTARLGGTLVGYFIFTVTRNKHYKHIVVAAEDLYFLAPESRMGFQGLVFLDFAVKAMEATKAHYGSLRCKVDHDQGPILKLLGFEMVETVWQKVFHFG